MDESRTFRLWRAREILGGVVILVWAGFHLWEQWSAFGGRTAFVTRLSATSHGPMAIAVEFALGILPVLAWVVLELRLRTSGSEPADLHRAMAEDVELARRLGLLTRVGTYVFFAWLLYHVGWLVWPKLAQGSEPLRTWVQLRDGMGTWAHAVPTAVGLTGFALHVWAALPRVGVVLDVARTPEMRRALRLSGLILALGFVLLYAQLAGWHAAGAGTIWSL